MKLVISTSSRIVKIGLSKELHEVLNDIYYVDIKKEPILPLTRLFFRALKLYEKTQDSDLWYFLYSPEIKERLMSAFSRKNQIDGETMQRELNSVKEFADDYMYFNKVYKKLANPPQSWYDKKFKERASRLKRITKNMK